MAVTVPTTLELFTQFKATIEGAVNQTTPALQKAYNTELSRAQAVIATGHYRYAAARIAGALWISAKKEDLDVLGQEYDLPRKQAQATVLTARLNGTDSTVIPATVPFVGDANGVTYNLNAGGTIGVPTSGYVDLQMTAELLDGESGSIGNLVVDQDTLTIGTQIAGAQSQALVKSIDTVGTDKENDEDYRQRGLFVVRATFGGWAPSDYKLVAEMTEGVKEAFPYPGKPVSLGLDSYPGDRTVYIESTSAIDTDGVPTSGLLDDARERINYDPDTGLGIQPLGLEDSTLYVEPIVRTYLYVKVTGLVVDATLEATVKTKIDQSLDLYFTKAKMYAAGVTLITERKDKITNAAISDSVQDVLENYGASAEIIALGLTSDVASPIPFYSLQPGELAKRGGAVVYA